MMWPFRRLADAGVLGINARNREVIQRYNPRKNFPKVDDKLVSKRLAEAAGVRVPRLVGVVEAHGDLRKLEQILGAEESFVVKPVKGAMGNGVLVVARREAGRFVRPDGESLSLRDLAYHVAGILAGLHSLGGRVDRAMVEERLLTDPTFERIAVGGVPDVRVIVFRGVPIMAMTRLPTRQSRGRANLHQGAIAAGIDLATGRTFGGVHKGRQVERHPDTGEAIAGVQMPRWEELLEIAARCADAFGLGYLGVDLVLDQRHGPVLLEANARPGLAIQIANGTGLWPRIQQVGALEVDGLAPEQRVRIARGLP